MILWIKLVILIMNNNNKIKKYDKLRHLYENKFLQIPFVKQEHSLLANLIQVQKRESSHQLPQQSIETKQNFKRQLVQKIEIFDFCQTENISQCYESMNAMTKKLMNPKVIQIKYQKKDDTERRANRIYYTDIKKKRISESITQKDSQRQKCQRSTRQNKKNLSAFVHLSRFTSQAEKKKYSIINLINELRHNRKNKKNNVLTENSSPFKSIKRLNIKENNRELQQRSKKLTDGSMRTISYSQRQKRYSHSQRAMNANIQNGNVQRSGYALHEKDCIAPWMVKDNQFFINM